MFLAKIDLPLQREGQKLVGLEAIHRSRRRSLLAVNRPIFCGKFTFSGGEHHESARAFARVTTANGPMAREKAAAVI